MARVAHKLALNERNVENGAVVVDELKQEVFVDELRLELRLRAMHLPLCHFQCDLRVELRIHNTVLSSIDTTVENITVQ